MNGASELEMQHFGFSTEQLSVERKCVLEKCLANELSTLISKLTTTMPDMKPLLEKEKKKVQEQMWQSFTESLKSLDELDKKNFSIPSHVLLLDDFGLLKKYTAQDELSIDEQLNAIKKLYAENSVMIAALKSENTLYDSLETHLQAEIKFCKDNKAILSSCNLDPLSKLIDGTKKIVFDSKK